MSIKLQSNPEVLIADLIELARIYGWQGDYLEVEEFVKWVIDQLDRDSSDYELEPYDDD